MAHADVFELAETSVELVVFFGGSGVDEEEYIERSKTLIPVFDSVLISLGESPITFMHVSAPYDVPYNRFASEPEALADWNAHVLTELLDIWNEIPFYVCSFSGGAALALNGIHEDPRCLGAAAFGADAIPANFECPEHWVQPLQLYCGPQDAVCNHLANQELYARLVMREQASIIPLRHGGHRLGDYATAESLGDFLRSTSAC
ncbi:hypothetical protein [Aeoliella sp.]|uniref:hypothetical protein n=1 Tax=Aeoliella sp. TaxID=2795800 RepID=UPI003CCB75E9